VKSLVKNPAVSLFNMEAGMVQPNPRGEVFNVLRQVRSVISILIAIIFILLIMILDHSLIVSVQRLHGKRGYVYSFLSGSILFSMIYYLSRIDFPYLNLKIIFIMGGIIGFLICLFSDMLNPVSKEEWEAGKAMGFSPREIMQEIVIPSSKPGFLYLLNKSKTIFK
ncbi:MAG: ABC transporter permease subunit, partial [bacterium]